MIASSFQQDSPTGKSVTGFLEDSDVVGPDEVSHRTLAGRKGPKRIVIVGGGLSGSLVALDLLHHQATSPIAITLIEKSRPSGLGVAYSTRNQFHLLNVPANTMGVPPNNPEHFVQWLGRRNFVIEPFGFAPRNLYAEYVRDLLVKASGQNDRTGSIGRVHDVATDLVPLTGGGFEVRTQSGRVLPASKVVLALGNNPPSNPRLPDMAYVRSSQYHQNPWGPDVFRNLKTGDTVLIIGTGLTMVDVVLGLYHRKHEGRILAVSTHGYVPAPHIPTSPYPSFHEELDRLDSVLDILNVTRKHLKRAQAEGIDWRSVIDSLRPYTQGIWLTLSLEERIRFMAHLRHLWGVARHRMPPECAGVVGKMMASGQLQVRAGRIRKIGDARHTINVDYTPRRSEEVVTVEAGVVINCTGPESDLEKINDPLVRNLLRRGLIRSDALAMGMDAKPDGSVFDREGKNSGCLYTLGPLLRGILWESTAVHEIRRQAHDLAHRLMGDV